MMPDRKILLFAGTTEGRILAERMQGEGIRLDVSVATEYGSTLLPEAENIRVLSGRMDREQITELLKRENYDLVLDATHPYAKQVSENIREACREADAVGLRVLRDREFPEYTLERAQKSGFRRVLVETAGQAVEFLKETTGNILVTTGSKELSEFTGLPDHEERIYARVLSLPQVVSQCADLGFSGKHLISMQGPFSKEMNQALIRHVDARWLVTKESGTAGGFLEKEQAAREEGTGLVIIGRPEEPEGGVSLEEAWKRILELCPMPRTLSVVGAGPGNLGLLTKETEAAIKSCDFIAGAGRVLKELSSLIPVGACVMNEYRPEPIREYLQSHGEYRRVVIAVSGDSGFYSGCRSILAAFKEQSDSGEKQGSWNMRVLPGISSMSYFFSAIGTSWERVHMVSLHGTKEELLPHILRHRQVFALLGDKDAGKKLAGELLDAGLTQAAMTVGTNLSYDNERIVTGRPEDFLQEELPPLSVVYVENPQADQWVVTHGLEDDAFLRGKVPMTKMEVRSISISKLKLQKDSVVYDVGAGTGSVAAECARLSPEIRVYAIERNPEAVELLKENRRRFGLSNLHVTEGNAPEAMEGLPAPSHVFIGGSGGNLTEIVKTVFRKNPGARIVINCITIETLAKAAELMKLPETGDWDVVQLTAARSRKAGNSHLMMGQNPVWIVSLTGKGGAESHE